MLGNNMFAYCSNNPTNMLDSMGHWPEWIEDAAKVVSVGVLIAATIAVCTTVTALTAGTGSALAVAASTAALGAALSGINGGVANDAKGNSYINGYAGGAIGGGIQSAGSYYAGPVGTAVGGGIGVAVGTATTDILNNIDPYSTDSTATEIVSNALISGGKALGTSTVTAFVGHASDMAVQTGALGLMPTYTYAFGEAVKLFFGWLDDALVYLV